MKKNEEKRVCVLQCRIPENAYGRLVRWTFCKFQGVKLDVLKHTEVRSSIVLRIGYYIDQMF